jgi:hypothetical protein
MPPPTASTIGLRASLAERFASRSDAEIDAALKRLHGTGAASELSGLHAQAASRLGDPDAIRFHLTHAWVFAMEAGEEARALELSAALREMGGLN